MSSTDDWRWPTEQKYVDEELDWEVRERYEYLKQYDTKPMNHSFLDTSSAKIELEHRVKLNKYRHQLDILTEQEKPQSTEQEESKVRYWEAKLHQHGPEDSSGSQLKIQLQQIEDKFLRAQDEYHKAKARVALQLEANTLHFLKTRDFYASNLTRAKETLEGIRTFKSKPRIKLEMEMKPHKDYLEIADRARAEREQDRKERDEWKALKAKIQPEMKAWLKEQRDEYWKEKDEQERDRQYRAMVSKRKEAVALLPEAEKEEHYKKYPEDRPYVATPRPVKQVKKTAKQTAEEQHTAICKEVLYGIIEQVMALGTLSESNGPEGYSSVAASPCATRGRLGQDPQ
jgi:hypothetical protein